MVIITTILGAFLNRCRGGLLSILFAPKDNESKYDTVGKLLNAFVFGLLCFYLTHNWLATIAGIAGMLIGASFGWGAYVTATLYGDYLPDRKHLFFIDWIMKDDKYIQLRGVITLSLRGLLWTLCIGVPLAFIDPVFLYFIPVGLLMGFVYYIAKKWNIAEYAWGAVLWSSLLLIGK